MWGKRDQEQITGKAIYLVPFPTPELDSLGVKSVPCRSLGIEPFSGLHAITVTWPDGSQSNQLVSRKSLEEAR